MIACYGFCLLRHTNKPACTLLHRELRDYSLGQIAFAVFQALFAITQLLFHAGKLIVNKRLQTSIIIM